MDQEGDQFIIIATDGLWDVMTSDEAVQYVQVSVTLSRGTPCVSVTLS
jgi:serine/threonine protein phosphatase PrpC